jgi:putative membrane protein insertion efficiency factor
MSPAAYLVSLPVRGYRLLASPWVGHGCRFQPTCSAYAMEALERHGAARGSTLMVSRICRCHPWGGHGYDPVPGADPEYERARARAVKDRTKDPAKSPRKP